MLRTDLSAYLHDYLKVSAFTDYAPNGLQVEGRSHIQHLVTGVSACEALIDSAIELNADGILVHHGYFWKNESPTITGIKYRRIKKLLDHGLNLWGYHLPLDSHPQLGNNAMLADLWQIKDQTEDEAALLRHGSLFESVSLAVLTERVFATLDRMPLVIGEAQRSVKKVAWCSGGAQGYFQQAIDLGVDAYITGEISEQQTHMARESGVAFIAAGHHATERLGVKMLGEHLAKRFELQVTFVDIDNPV